MGIYVNKNSVGSFDAAQVHAASPLIAVKLSSGYFFLVSNKRKTKCVSFVDIVYLLLFKLLYLKFPLKFSGSSCSGRSNAHGSL